MTFDTTDKLIAVGVIKGAHGVRGDVRVKSYTADPTSVFEYGDLYSETGEIMLVPKQVRSAKDHFIVTPHVQCTKEVWDNRKGLLLYVPRSVLPDIAENEFYISDLVGMDVLEGGMDVVGTVCAVQNFGADDLIEIRPKNGGRSVLIPFTQRDVPTVDLLARRLIIPELSVWRSERDKEKPNKSSG